MSTPRALANFDAQGGVEEPNDVNDRVANLHPTNATLGSAGQKMAVNLIEAAMNRALQPTSESVQIAQTQAANDRSIWQQEQDAALRLRLAQLEYAQAGQKPKIADKPSPLPHAAAQNFAVKLDATGIKASPPRQESPRSAALAGRRSARWTAAPMAILGAAGLGWFMLDAQNAPRTQEPTQSQPTALVSASPALAPRVHPPGADYAAAPDKSPGVRDLVERWRQAWMARDIPTYLAFYSPQFVPPRGQSHAQWQAARRKALSRSAGIEVAITNLHLQFMGDNQIKVYFLQDYTSGAYREVAQPKTLMLVRSGTHWLITRELQGASEGAKVGTSP